VDAAQGFLLAIEDEIIVLSFHPLVLFYTLGILLTLLGFLGGLYSIYYKFVEGGPMFVRGVLSLLVFILGVQFLLFAMLFDMEVDNSEQRSGRYE